MRAHPRTPEGLVAGYYLYQAAASCVFFSPIFFVYYQERAGLSIAAVLWLQSWNLVVRATLDVPLGAVADRWSRRACLVGYAVGQALGAAVLLAAPSLAAAIVAETAFAAGAAFKSGADSAFLYDQLKTMGALALYPRAESRAQAVVSLASGTTAVAGGLLAAVDLRLPYAVTLVAALASATVVARLAPDAPAGRASARVLMLDAARHALGSAPVRWVIALAAFSVVSSHVYFYLQQPYLRSVGVPLALFGVVFAATKVVTALVASGAHRVDAVLGPRRTTAIMAATPVVGLAAMSAVAGPAGALLLLTRGVLDGLWQPLLNVYMNRLVDSRLRATMLSVQSLVARLALAAALALLGAGAARVGVGRTLAAAAAAAAIVGVALVAAGPHALGTAPLAGEATCDSTGA